MGAYVLSLSHPTLAFPDWGDGIQCLSDAFYEGPLCFSSLPTGALGYKSGPPTPISMDLKMIVMGEYDVTQNAIPNFRLPSEIQISKASQDGYPIIALGVFDLSFYASTLL